MAIYNDPSRATVSSRKSRANGTRAVPSQGRTLDSMRVYRVPSEVPFSIPEMHRARGEIAVLRQNWGYQDLRDARAYLDPLDQGPK